MIIQTGWIDILADWGLTVDLSHLTVDAVSPGMYRSQALRFLSLTPPGWILNSFTRTALSTYT